jgi:hypothetical protein
MVVARISVSRLRCMQHLRIKMITYGHQTLPTAASSHLQSLVSFHRLICPHLKDLRLKMVGMGTDPCLLQLSNNRTSVASACMHQYAYLCMQDLPIKMVAYGRCCRTKAPLKLLSPNHPIKFCILLHTCICRICPSRWSHTGTNACLLQLY